MLVARAVRPVGTGFCSVRRGDCCPGAQPQPTVRSILLVVRQRLTLFDNPVSPLLFVIPIPPMHIQSQRLHCAQMALQGRTQQLNAQLKQQRIGKSVTRPYVKRSCMQVRAEQAGGPPPAWPRRVVVPEMKPRDTPKVCVKALILGYMPAASPKWPHTAQHAEAMAAVCAGPALTPNQAHAQHDGQSANCCSRSAHACDGPCNVGCRLCADLRLSAFGNTAPDRIARHARIHRAATTPASPNALTAFSPPLPNLLCIPASSRCPCWAPPALSAPRRWTLLQSSQTSSSSWPWRQAPMCSCWRSRWAGL